jgi:NADPH-ferrihemoprotein reductase
MLLVLSAVIGLAAADDDSSAVADAMMDPMVLGCLALVVLGLLGYLVSTWFASKPVVPPTATTGRAVAGAGSGSKSPPAPVEEDTSLCPLSIYYGSQTGTAEGFAKQISNDSKKHGFRPTVVDLDGFEASWLTDPPKNAAFPRVAIFVTATYGEGEPTDNAVNFVKWLKSEASDTAMYWRFLAGVALLP